MKAHWKTVGVGELRGGRVQSGVKIQRQVALGRDFGGWNAGVQTEMVGEKLEEDKVVGKVSKRKKPASGGFSPLLSVLRSKRDDREKDNCLNSLKCQDKRRNAPASGRALTAMKGKG